MINHRYPRRTVSGNNSHHIGVPEQSCHFSRLARLATASHATNRTRNKNQQHTIKTGQWGVV